MYALDLCAKHYPKLPIPYTYLCMLVAGLSAVPKADGTKTQELRRRVSGNNKAMQKKYKRTIISLPKEQAVRASVDGEDVFNWSGVRAVKGALTAIQRAQEIETLFDVSTIKKTDANAENLEWYKALSPLLTRVSKQAPALPSGEAAKPDAKPKKK
jgi:hypothetical protein